MATKIRKAVVQPVGSELINRLRALVKKVDRVLTCKRNDRFLVLYFLE